MAASGDIRQGKCRVYVREAFGDESFDGQRYRRIKGVEATVVSMPDGRRTYRVEIPGTEESTYLVDRDGVEIAIPDGSGIAEILALCRSGDTVNLPQAESLELREEGHALAVDGQVYALPDYHDAEIRGSKVTFSLNGEASCSLGAAVQEDGRQFGVSLDSRKGLMYTLQSNGDLTSAWSDVETVPETGESLELTVGAEDIPTIFIRVEVTEANRATEK